MKLARAMGQSALVLSGRREDVGFFDSEAFKLYPAHAGVYNLIKPQLTNKLYEETDLFIHSAIMISTVCKLLLLFIHLYIHTHTLDQLQQ